MITVTDVIVAVQAVRGMLSFFLAIGLWKTIDKLEKQYGTKTAMIVAFVVSVIAFFLLEEFPNPNLKN